MKDILMTVKEFHPGMGQAVAERTILRKIDGKWENWADVANRVSLGNTLLNPKDQKDEFRIMHAHMLKGNVLMSGRHLQHGDEDQPNRSLEIFSNCATSCTSFSMFLNLMSGSGVGRAYDDDMMLVNWDNAPNLRCVLDDKHPDFDFSAHESVRDAKHKYGNGKDVLWHVLEDTREGWAKSLELWENSAFEKIHRDKLLILDFSKIRPNGTPIKGMQGRPASGPISLINAFNKAATLKGSGLDRWKQTIYVDHYFAECVLVGGARRAARMSTKSWRDKTVIDFISIKRPIEYDDKSMEEVIEFRKTNQLFSFLWSSNNSITVDAEFWSLLELKRTDPKYVSDLAKHARKVFNHTCERSFGDGNGEPGFINEDKLCHNTKGLESITRDYIGSKRYIVSEDTQVYLDRLLKTAKRKKNWVITNPCVTADTWVMTSTGPRTVEELIDRPFKAVVNGREYDATGFWSTGKKEVIEIKTNRGYSLTLTKNHKLLVERSRKPKFGGGYNVEQKWIEASSLIKGDRLVLNNHRDFSWKGDGNFEHGWLTGQIVGDGGYNPELYATYVRFWGESKSEMTKIALDAINLLNLKTRSDFTGGNFSEIHDSETTKCVALNDLVKGLIEVKTKKLTPNLERMSSAFYCGFLRGFFDADGTVLDSEEKGRSIRLAQSDVSKLYIVQKMLARLGIISTVYEDRKEAGMKKMPDGKGGEKFYFCETIHELIISKDNMIIFENIINFSEPAKKEKLNKCIDSITRGAYKERFTTKVIDIINKGEKEVYDCTVAEVHRFDANGFVAHNCGEISLAVFGGFCVIADLALFHSDTLDEAEDACRCATRALIRVNSMDSIYAQEVKRTNRIGVGLTGVFEFAWKFFNYSFYDLIDEEKTKDFWMTLARFKRAVKDEAEKYSKKLGVEIPHTDTTVKPSGTISKLFGLTEGWHLPAMGWYMRWVQFSENDPLVKIYIKNGYPSKKLETYKNTVIIGFPTSLVISSLGLGDKFVSADEASPEDQYKWLMLGEKYWLRGVDEKGVPLESDTSNSISYTLKYDPNVVDFKSFKKTILEYQSKVKCCSVMPKEEKSSYEYLPEQMVTKAEYESIVAKIKTAMTEDIGLEHLVCENGACPVDYNKKE